MSRRGRRRAGACAVLLLGLSLAWARTAAAAGEGSIDHIESSNGVERVLFSIADLPPSTRPKLPSVVVSLDGVPVDAVASPASAASGQVARTVVLVIDASESMSGAPFDAAKSAARRFVAKAPADVRIGVVAFAGTVVTAQSPTLDRTAVGAALDHLRLSTGTYLYDGVLAALATAGTDGQRRLLVLTDGRDTTSRPVTAVVGEIRKAGAQVDAVALHVPAGVRPELQRITAAGNGTLVNAADPAALDALFASEAQALVGQVMVSFPVPSTKADAGAQLTVSIDAAGSTFSDSAFITLGSVAAGPTEVDRAPAASSAGPHSRSSLVILVGGVGIVAIAVFLMAYLTLGFFTTRKRPTVDVMLAGYGGLTLGKEPAPSALSVKDSALELTSKAIGTGGFEARLSWKLGAAGLSLKPAEWVLLHAGIAAAAALVGVLLSGGQAVLTLIVVLFGVLAPWLYLGRKESRRIKAFNAQLAEGLQLVSGALTAGLSLAQALDTIVREGSEPMAGEFRRALVETRLGVGIEDALEGVAERMGSKDFAWVVMAVRIQREVGGNLAELLLTVATTLREREYLRRQVRSLSAEGRLSAWILGGMPPLFLAYLSVTNPDGLAPLFHTTIGLVLLAVAILLMTVGTLWMSKAVKVEV